jgi:hypothetical protein
MFFRFPGQNQTMQKTPVKMTLAAAVFLSNNPGGFRHTAF